MLCFIIINLPNTVKILRYYREDEGILKALLISQKVTHYEKDGMNLIRVDFNSMDNPTILAFKNSIYEEQEGLIIIDGNDTVFFSYDEILKKVQSQLEQEQKENFYFTLNNRGFNAEYTTAKNDPVNNERIAYDAFSIDLKYSDKNLSVLLYQEKSKDDTITRFIDIESDKNLSQTVSITKTLLEAISVNDKDKIREITTEECYIDEVLYNKILNAEQLTYIYFNPVSTKKSDGINTFLSNVRIKVIEHDPISVTIEMNIEYKYINNKMLISSIIYDVVMNK